MGDSHKPPEDKEDRLASQPSQPSNKIVRFGPFEADLQTGELRKRGLKLKLQELPFRFLVFLLEHPGELVTREELQAQLWPGGTFVDFERGLGTALYKVREALGDSAAAPRFIDTLPGRGYRFIAEVQKEIQKEIQKPEVEKDETPAPHQIPARNHVAAALIAGAVVVVLISGAAYSRLRNRPGPITDHDILVLDDFNNTTGDGAFDGALRQALAFELEQSPFLKIMDDEEVNQTVQLMGRPAGQRITDDIAHEVCVREGQKATIGGSIASLGNTYLIALQAVNCQTGATLAREQALAEGKEQVLKAVSKAAVGIRAELGESLSSVQKPDRVAALEVTTPSLEAFKAYAMGMDLQFQGKPWDAIPHLQRAIELDPTFAQAYELLGAAYPGIGDRSRGDEYLAKAFTLAGHASERERLFISGGYYTRVTHELNKAVDAYQVLTRIDPRNPRPHNRLSSIYVTRGEYEKALEEELEAFHLAPRFLASTLLLMIAYMDLDRFDEAKAVAAKASAQKLDAPRLHQLLLTIAYLQNDRGEQEKEIQWFEGKPEEFQGLDVQATNAAIHGQERRAKDLYQQASELARRRGFEYAGLPAEALAAVTGRCEALHKGKAVGNLLLCGDPEGARLLDEQDTRRPPENRNTSNRLYRRGEYQAILEHKFRNMGLYYSLSYLGLARAAAKEGETAKARRAYQDFLTLWREADKDAPNLIRAKKELAALR